MSLAAFLGMTVTEGKSREVSYRTASERERRGKSSYVYTPHPTQK